MSGLTRRHLVASLSMAALPAAHAAPEDLAEALRLFANGQPWREGRIKLDIAQLVDNGNLVPVSVAVESPMTEADHVRELALFNERNPQHEVVRFKLTPRSGVARVATRIRLATTQQVVACARMSDGSCWLHRVEVVVTLAACID